MAAAGQQKPFWHPVVAIVLAAATFVGAQLLASVPFALYPVLRHWTNDQANAWIDGAYIQFVYVLLAESMTIAAIWQFTRQGGLRLRDLGWGRFRARFTLYALGGFAVYFVAYVLLLVVSDMFFPNIDLNQQQDIGFQQVYGAGALTVTFLSLVILPPLAEELFFRGFLFTSFRRHMKLPIAILLTSLLFAVPHLLESKQPGSLLWVAGIDTFTLSLVLCYLREKTGSLWPGMLLHGIKNLIAFVALYIIVAH